MSTLSELIRSSERILLFTGAGISTNSGIPDYRGPKGVWKTKQPVYYQDFMRSEAKRLEYWHYKMDGWAEFRDANPNSVHRAAVDLENAGKLLLVVTQNIDGLHSKAGTSRERLIEIHGTNSLVECQSCHDFTDPEPHFVYVEETGKAPLCHCGGLLKPATISFGQGLREGDLHRAMESALEADLVISLGSTLSVYPAAHIPLAAAQRGTPYAIINRGETDHDGQPFVTLRLDGDVGEIFPAAVEEGLG